MTDPFPPAGSEAGLTNEQRETLRVLLDMIVPPSGDGLMPGGAEAVSLLHDIAEGRNKLPAFGEGLHTLEREARTRFGTAFAVLDEVRRASLVHEMHARDPSFLDQLALETVTCYYQQDRVLEGLGMEARPPYPKGYQVAQGDLSLLHPVIARGRIYRDVP